MEICLWFQISVYTVMVTARKLKMMNTCCEIVHGIKSPDALLPRAKLFMIEDFDISPSKQILKQQAFFQHTARKTDPDIPEI